MVRSPGRPRGTRLERARRAALRAKRKFDAVQLELDERLVINPDVNADEVRSIMEVKDARMEAARLLLLRRQELLGAKQALRQAEPHDCAALERREVAARESAKEASQKYRSLPELGFSRKSWNDLPAAARRRGPGKPMLDVDFRLVEAEQKLEEAVGELKKVEQEEGAPHVPIERIHDPVRKQKVGRPRLDRMGVLDQRLKHLKKKQLKIEGEPDVPERSTFGRPRIPKAVKLAKLEAEIDAILAQISALESGLAGSVRTARELKLLRDERQAINRQIHKEGATPNLTKRARELTRKIDILKDRPQDAKP